MSVHPQFEEDLALYALGSLPRDEQAALDKHVDGCPDCRRELENLRGDAALIALSAAGPAPPRRARERLLAAVAREPRMKVVPPSHPWRMRLQWLTVAAVVAIAFGLWQRNAGLKSQIAQLDAELENQQAQLVRAREVVETLTATDAMQVTLVVAKTTPQPQGKAIYRQGRGGLILVATNLPPIPAAKAYELWLIPTVGAPVPAGVFLPDAHGSATVVNPPLPSGVAAKAFAITVEPQGGSSTPTMPIVMLGAGE